MVITNLKQQSKNPNRVSIFVDGTYALSLTIEQVVDLKVRIGYELNEQELKNLKKLSDEGKLRARTLDWLLKRPHSEKELREYLYRKNIEKDQIESVVLWAQTRGYQDDNRFAEWLVELRLRKNKSSRSIRNELRDKGINQETIQNVVSRAGMEPGKNDIDNLRAVARKLASKPRYQDPNKLTRYLLSKGFSYGDIKDVLKNTD